MRYQFELKGISPLMFHFDDVEWSDVMDQWRKDPDNKKASKAGDDRSPAWSWIGYTYHDGQHVALPAANLSKCLSQAGARMVLKGKKTFKEEAVSGVWIEQDHLKLLVNGKQIPIAAIHKLQDEPVFRDHTEAVKKMAPALGKDNPAFRLDVRRAAIGMSKHVRVRPRFEEWAASGTLLTESDVLTPEILTSLFNIAGRLGVGSWRPGGKTPGRFGMFASSIKSAK